MTNLSWTVERGEGAVRLALAGELDIGDLPGLEQQVAEIEDDGPPLLVIDLRGLSFMDSSGLRFILERDARARREARRVALVPGPEAVHRIFLIALLDKRLEFVDPVTLESIDAD